MELLGPVVAGVLAVVAVGALGRRTGVAGPLLLVVVGMAVSALPFVPDVHVAPELVLELVLPPLLYSSAITTPTMDFRRDLSIISGLSVTLVLVSALVVGLLLHALVPDVSLAAAIAVGAVVSPTDAVATSLVRRAGVSSRVVTVLDGEAMLNDASALVLLRSAVAATAVTVSLVTVAWRFVVAVVVAIVVGWAVGRLNVAVRARLQVPAASVAVSLVAPFVAWLGAEPLGGSGLVAAVTAGLITGYHGPRDLPAADRLAESAVWSTAALVAEGGVFLLMGLQADALLHEVHDAHGSAVVALGLGALVATVVVLLRGAFLAPSLWGLNRRRRRLDDERARLADVSRRLDEGPIPTRGRREPSPERAAARMAQFRETVARRSADLDYLAARRLGPKEGVVLVWAGMRGAVTVAAAQSLPADTPQRPLLVLTAFVVAAGTLLVQGSTLPWLVRRLRLDGDPDPSQDRAALRAALLVAGLARLDEPGLRRADGTEFSPETLAGVRSRAAALQARLLAPDEESAAVRADYTTLRRAMIDAQRTELMRLRSLGSYPSAVLDEALVQLDSDQLGLDMH